MKVIDLLDKKSPEIDYIELISLNKSLGSFTLDDENYDYVKPYLDREVKMFSFRTYDDYTEDSEGEMYSLGTNIVLEIEIWDESQYGKF